jgi:hypothetical protein
VISSPDAEHARQLPQPLAVFPQDLVDVAKRRAEWCE